MQAPHPGRNGGGSVKVMRGQKLTTSDYSSIEKQLKDLFYEVIFKPIVDLLSPHNAQVRAAKRELRNARTGAVSAALLSGKIQYYDDTFSGDFSAAISRELRSYGAKYNKRDRTYSVLPQMLPVDVLEAAKEYDAAAKRLHDELERRLKEVQITLGKSIGARPVDAKKVVEMSDKKFQAIYGDALGTGDLAEHSKAALAREYEDSITPYIKDFSDEMISELRGIVAENARAGYRFDHLVAKIQNRYDVSQNKAEFLARQETSLFTSKVREVRFGEVGVEEYIWRTAGDSEVREDHKKLNGKKFRFDEPPVVDATGRRANPGEDFNCRCVSEPVIPGVLANA